VVQVERGGCLVCGVFVHGADDDGESTPGSARRARSNRQRTDSAWLNTGPRLYSM
jgi:hypothetical protein